MTKHSDKSKDGNNNEHREGADKGFIKHDSHYKDEYPEPVEHLKDHYVNNHNQPLTTNFGVKISDNQNSLRAGTRGSTLLQDFIMREKIAHFDRERIPERVVHARAVGVHGYFESNGDHSDITSADFLSKKGKKTPLFTRISTVQGGRGSADTVRDVRGFALKFYTDTGNFDLVGNNLPVFFVQDAIKFPDFVHAVKPEAHTDTPTGGSAHNTFWDFVSLVPETAHTVIWAMSDRGIPRNLRSIEGFGVHTYRLVNAQGKSVFVKFHWKPLQGLAQNLWDEAQKIAGKNCDFHRQDMYDNINAGNFPEWELGVQIIPEEDELRYNFDILDPTKIVPEELVPVKILGKIVLNRCPDNFFAETEQVAFSPANIVSGIDYSNDPLLQGRIFSYTDTQFHRLGGANFNQIPINQPRCPFHNNTRDGFGQKFIHQAHTNYQPNSIDADWPRETPADQGGYQSIAAPLDGHQIRTRSESFSDHFTQPALYWNSLAKHEQDHVVNGYSFELSKVDKLFIRERTVNEILVNINPILAQRVADNLGIKVHNATNIDERKKHYKQGESVDKSPAVSMLSRPAQNIKGRKIAVLADNGFNCKEFDALKKQLESEGAFVKLLGKTFAPIISGANKEFSVDGSHDSEPSVLYDGVIVTGGEKGVQALLACGHAKHYLLEAYKHLKPILLVGESSILANELKLAADEGCILAKDGASGVKGFSQALKQHRIWAREEKVTHLPA